MAKKINPKTIEAVLAKATDESSFLSHVLIDLLDWKIDPGVKTVESIAYEWSNEDLKVANLDEKVLEGQVRQIVLDGCPWGIFIVEFKNPDVFTTGRGMTVPLRQILSGLVKRDNPNLRSFRRDHLLFICTYKYQYFRFVHFKNPGPSAKQPVLASFGWYPGDSTKTVSTYNLPHLAFLDDDATVDDWIATWTKAFDVERVTKKFYLEYKDLHKAFADAAKNVLHANDRPWLASVLLNRLMFVYFLQRKGFIDGCKQHYLEEKLASSKRLGKNHFYGSFLSLLFFEGFAKPKTKRSEAAKEMLGDIRYLNGGLFLEHPIEQAARVKGQPVDWPDSVFDAALKFFGSFSWNLNDVPGGEDNEINPDVLGYILEKYVNQKAFGAYYTRPEITGYLCERTIHRLVLDAVNTPDETVEAAKKVGLTVRLFETVPQLLKKLDDKLATRLLDKVLPSLSLLDPACGSGAFLVAAMKTLIDLYQGVLGWIPFHGNAKLKARLAQIHHDHASLDYFIKHRIITDNLYGVDLMPEAVEIARLRLFLSLAASVEKVDQLEPLPNIDFNVMDGNSLIGLLHVDPAKVTSSNIFDKPYEQIILDRDLMLETYRHTAAYSDDLTAQRDAITAIDDKAQLQLDLLLLNQFEDLKIKFEQATWDDKNGRAGKPIKRPLAPDDIARLRPFHWAFSFSKVMCRGGFDAIITNPPWEIVKPNSKEFFETYSDVVTKKSMTIHDFEAEREKLLKDKETRVAWLGYLSTYPYQNEFYRSAAEYKNQSAVINGKRAGSDLNLYKLFVERCFRLLRERGQCGIVIPSGIYTDLGSKGLREMLFECTEIDGLFGFENRAAVFEDVDTRFKFVVLSFGRGGKTESFPAAFMRHNVSELEHFPGTSSIPVTVSLARRLSPDSLSIIEFRSPSDVSVLEKLSRFPLLYGDKKGWNLEIYGEELHMNRSSHLFLKSATNIPLYEGGMIWHFDHRHDEAQYWVKESAIASVFKDKRVKRIEGLTTAPENLKNDYESIRLAIRKIASNTNERTLVATLIPAFSVVGNSLSVHFPFQHVREQHNDLRFTSRSLLVLVGLLNSYVADYCLRLRMTTNVNSFYLYQLPIPHITASNPAFAPIVERSAKLICTTPEFDELAKEAGLNPPDHTASLTEPDERAKLRAELDAIVAHLYGLTDEQFAHVLETFPLVDASVRAAALNEFTRMVETGEAATFNPELAKPVVAAAVDPAAAIKDLIAKGESATLEFKSTARWNVKMNQLDAKMERVIVKTIAAFLNAKGGTLIIGVEDVGTIYGLYEDYKLCGNKGRDGFENWLMQTLMKDFGKDAAAQLHVEFHQLGSADEAKPGSADVCLVKVEPSPKPRFASENGQELFYVRTGNATNALKLSEFLTYAKQRWPETIASSAG